MCDADYISASRLGRHLHQHVEDHKRSKIGNHYKQFQNLKKVSEQTRLFDFCNAFYLWTQTKTEQTEWFDRCEAMYLIISLLNIFYRFINLLSVSFIVHCLYVNILEFLVRISLAFSQLYISTYWFFSSELENDLRRSKRHSFLKLIFILKLLLLLLLLLLFLFLFDPVQCVQLSSQETVVK